MNIDKPIVKIKHEDLEKVSENSLFRCKCPVCKCGILLVQRNKKTFDLIPDDMCIACGQHFYYTDLENGEFKYFHKINRRLK